LAEWLRCYLACGLLHWVWILNTVAVLYSASSGGSPGGFSHYTGTVMGISEREVQTMRGSFCGESGIGTALISDHSSGLIFMLLWHSTILRDTHLASPLEGKIAIWNSPILAGLGTNHLRSFFTDSQANSPKLLYFNDKRNLSNWLAGAFRPSQKQQLRTAQPLLTSSLSYLLNPPEPRPNMGAGDHSLCYR